MSIMICIVLVPILFIQSNKTETTVVNPQTISFANRNTLAEIKSNPAKSVSKIISQQNTPAIYNNTDNKGNSQIQNLDVKQNAVILNDNVKSKEKNNEKQIAAVNPGNIEDISKTTSIKKEMPDLTANTGKDAAKVDSAQNNKVAQVPDDKTAKNNNANSKHHKKYKKNVLVPHLSYNGL